MIEIRKLLKRTRTGKYLSVTLQYRYLLQSPDNWSDWFNVQDIDADTGEKFISENEWLKMQKIDEETEAGEGRE